MGIKGKIYKFLSNSYVNCLRLGLCRHGAAVPVPRSPGPGPMDPWSRSHGPKVPVPWAQGPGPMGPRSRSYGPNVPVPWAQGPGRPGPMGLAPCAQGPGPMSPRPRSHGPKVPRARAQGPSELVIKGLYAIFCSYTFLIKSKYLDFFDAVIIKIRIKMFAYI